MVIREGQTEVVLFETLEDKSTITSNLGNCEGIEEHSRYPATIKRIRPVNLEGINKDKTSQTTIIGITSFRTYLRSVDFGFIISA